MKNLSLLISRKNIWFVYFYKQGDQNFEPYVKAMIEFADKTQGLFNAGAVNCIDLKKFVMNMMLHKLL